MSKSLDELVAQLEESLENTPDVWFDHPQGWLKKPSFNRPAQDKSSINKQFTIFDKILSATTYKTKWFLLDYSKKLLMYFKNDDPATPPSGVIDLNNVIDISLSQVFDAPEFALDLITADKHYTVVTDSHANMVRWAFAFTLAIKKERKKPAPIEGLLAPRESIMGLLSPPKATKEKWYEYSVDFKEPGPLMVNVMGTVERNREGNVINREIIVTSFENYPDGRPGRAEASGKISARDILYAVNDIDLSESDFNEAMDIIVNQSWPKTLHFKRNITGSRDDSLIEGWAIVYYPSLNRRLRRYVDLRKNMISFRKSEPGGAACYYRNAFILTDHISYIRPIIDKTVPSDQQYTLQLVCNGPKAVINHVDESNIIIGGTPVDIVELCFSKQAHLDSWKATLMNNKLHPTTPITAVPIETIEAIEITSVPSSSTIAIKNSITGTFSVRCFSFSEGTLQWRRDLDSTTNTAAGSVDEKGKKPRYSKARTLFIANTSTCGVKHLAMIEDLGEIQSGFIYQLDIINNDDIHITIGMKNEIDVRVWYNILKEAIMTSPADAHMHLNLNGIIEKSRHFEPEFPSNFTHIIGEEDEEMISSPVRNHDDNILVQGYLFVKILEKATLLTMAKVSKKFKKRWFVLSRFELLYYKSSAEAMDHTLALGHVDLRTAISVNESTDENAFEMITPTHIYYLVAQDESDQILWIDTLADKLLEKNMTSLSLQQQQHGGGGGGGGISSGSSIKGTSYSGSGSNSNTSSEVLSKYDYIHRREQLSKAILYSGMLSKKTSALNVLQERYFVLLNGSLSFYNNEEEYYDDEKQPLGEIPLIHITSVTMSTETKWANKGFDIATLTREGGDANGIKINTFIANTEELCIQWMRYICTATGTLVLTQNSDGIWQSEVSAEAMRQRNKIRVQAAFFKPEKVLHIKKVAGVKESHDLPKISEDGDDDGIDTDTSPIEKLTRQFSAFDKRAQTSIRTNTTAGRGMGGGNTSAALNQINPMAASRDISIDTTTTHK